MPSCVRSCVCVRSLVRLLHPCVGVTAFEDMVRSGVAVDSSWARLQTYSHVRLPLAAFITQGSRNCESSMPESSSGKKRIAYFYDSEVGNYHFGYGHPMKPHRVRMAHELIVNYGLYQKMDVYRPRLASKEDLMKFHSEEYLDFLRTITRDTMQDHVKEMKKFSVGQDCPVFDGVYDFSTICASGSIGGAQRLNEGSCDIAVNWAGGLHHAKKAESSGFCYVNDCVLAIIELLHKHERVLYLDIDIHHGDGVEEAFLTTNRVMTCSFHKYGDYFPGTGNVNDIGVGNGKNYAINFPLNDWIDDEQYKYIFKTVVGEIMQNYRPTAIVLQCGADSLAGDRLGVFNLTMKAHAACVDFVQSFNTPVMILGGGGYTMKNVARLWTYETSVLLGMEVSNNLPANEYFEYFGPDYKLHVDPIPNVKNMNSTEYLDEVMAKVLSTLRALPGAPSVQIQTGAAGTAGDNDSLIGTAPVSSKEAAEIAAEAAHDKGEDERKTLAAQDMKVDHPLEHFAGDEDQDGESSAMDVEAPLEEATPAVSTEGEIGMEDQASSTVPVVEKKDEA